MYRHSLLLYVQKSRKICTNLPTNVYTPYILISSVRAYENYFLVTFVSKLVRCYICNCNKQYNPTKI